MSALQVFNVVQAISIVNRVSERQRGPSKLLLQLAHIDTNTHWLYRVSWSSCNRFAVCRLKQSFCRRGPTAAALNTIPLRHVAHFASVAKFKWLWKCTRAAWGEDNFKNHSDSAGVKGVLGGAEQLFDKHLGREWQQNATRVANENFWILCTLIFRNYQRKQQQNSLSSSPNIYSLYIESILPAYNTSR